MKIPFRNLRPWIAVAITLFTLAFTQQLPAVEAILIGDSYTDADHVNDNYGAKTSLLVAGSGNKLQRAWINFDLASVLPTGTAAAQVSKATLKIWVNTVKTGGPINLYAVTGTPAWAEGTGQSGSGITDGTAPALAASPFVSNWQITSEDNYAVVDVTSLVQSWISNPSSNLGIALTPALPTVNVAFDSKEATGTSHEPQLQIQLVNQGPVGPQGPQGLTGAAGSTGPQGLPGLTGPAGPQGLQGTAGPAGPTGATGPQGLTGNIGPAGATGPVGPKGLNWKGAWSSTTAYGVDDAISTNGSSYVALLANTNVQPPNATYWSLLSQKGDTGSTGPQGPQGLTGADGAIGPQGPQGLTGADGATGPQGPVGETGAAGAAGAAGPQGEAGATGPKGLNWEGTWSDTTAYAADDAVSINGSSYIAVAANTNVQPPNATYWSLLSQKGDTGSTGAQGQQGLTGADGAAGPIGPVGPQGSQGLTGADGAAGPQGPVGPIGPQGPQGPQGDSFWLTQGGNIYFNTGAIGIGTATPTHTLEVAGDTQISGNFTITGSGSKIVMPVQGDISMGEFTAP